MPVLPIVLYPDPILRSPARDATPGTPETTKAAQDLIDTLNSHEGVGIAAPQIGSSLRIIAVDATRARRPVENHGPLLLLNPVIVSATGSARFREGCLSLPDLIANVSRHNEVTVTALQLNGAPFTCTSRGFEAVIIQHEIDHLNGILFIDRVNHVRDIKSRS